LLLIKLLLIITLFFIFIQDLKERQVFWFLFPILGLCTGFLLYQNALPELVLPVFSLIFSLILHLFLSRNSTLKTVPLAGYMSLFFACVYTSNWFGLINSVYTI